MLRPLDKVEFREGEELKVVVLQPSFKGFSEEASKHTFKVDRDIAEEFAQERR